MTSITVTQAHIDQATTLTSDNVDVLPAGLLAQKIAIAESEGRSLRIKLGVDPTTADIHLGHCVVLQKLRQFQDAGHHAVLIIGDYTARVGDPSGRSKSRPVLSADEIEYNADTYQKQAFKILDPDRVEVRWNGEWLSAMTPEQMFQLMRLSTIARLLERDDFAKRYGAGEPISLLELLYPMLQGYDSVAVMSDVELGGTDQLYNLLMGREVMPAYGLEPQVVLTSPILVGTDGTEKMSKSLGNYIGVTDEPANMFGKAMSIPDEAMAMYYRYAAGLDPAEASKFVLEVSSDSIHPNAAKRRLAACIVRRLYDDDAATAAEAHFDRVFKERSIPDDIPEVTVAADDLNDAGRVFLPAFLVRHLGVASNGEARRLIIQGGVKIDGEAHGADSLELEPSQLEGTVVQVGKRKFARVTTNA